MSVTFCDLHDIIVSHLFSPDRVKLSLVLSLWCCLFDVGMTIVILSQFEKKQLLQYFHLSIKIFSSNNRQKFSLQSRVLLLINLLFFSVIIGLSTFLSLQWLLLTNLTTKLAPWRGLNSGLRLECCRTFLWSGSQPLHYVTIIIWLSQRLC